MTSNVKNYLIGIVFFSMIYLISKFSVNLSLIVTIFSFIVLVIKKRKYYKNRNMIHRITEEEYKKEMSDKIKDGLSPFHMLLYMLITHIVWILIFIDNKDFFYFILTFLIIYSIIYYKTLSVEYNITIWQSIKADFPDFALPDMNIFHVLIFIIIAGPFLFFIGSIIIGIISS
ncbi:MAG: hypothetical protein ACNI3C_11675 [Candidatus Marinarcus sp.]|uniref:hypothetical protein n=1 Tax=Candidatus Marinarcus sp. TaxID=3100987 RepID=UPI003B0010C8